MLTVHLSTVLDNPLCLIHIKSQFSSRENSCFKSNVTYIPLTVVGGQTKITPVSTEFSSRLQLSLDAGTIGDQL